MCELLLTKLQLRVAVGVVGIAMLTWMRSYVAKLTLRLWIRSNPIYAITCRIAVVQNGTARRFRVTYLQSRALGSDTESTIHEIVNEWLSKNKHTFENEPAIKWKQGHLITVSILAGEDSATLQLIQKLREQRLQRISMIEERGVA